MSSEAGPGPARRKPGGFCAREGWVISPQKSRPRKPLALPARPLLSPQTIHPASLPSAHLPGPAPCPLYLGKEPRAADSGL